MRRLLPLVATLVLIAAPALAQTSGGRAGGSASSTSSSSSSGTSASGGGGTGASSAASPSSGSTGSGASRVTRTRSRILCPDSNLGEIDAAIRGDIACVP